MVVDTLGLTRPPSQACCLSGNEIIHEDTTNIYPSSLTYIIILVQFQLEEGKSGVIIANAENANVMQNMDLNNITSFYMDDV